MQSQYPSITIDQLDAILAGNDNISETIAQLYTVCSSLGKNTTTAERGKITNILINIQQIILDKSNIQKVCNVDITKILYCYRKTNNLNIQGNVDNYLKYIDYKTLSLIDTSYLFKNLQLLKDRKQIQEVDNNTLCDILKNTKLTDNTKPEHISQLLNAIFHLSESRGMVIQDGDKTKLTEIINCFIQKDKSNYTPLSISIFLNALRHFNSCGLIDKEFLITFCKNNLTNLIKEFCQVNKDSCYTPLILNTIKFFICDLKVIEGDSLIKVQQEMSSLIGKFSNDDITSKSAKDISLFYNAVTYFQSIGVINIRFSQPINDIIAPFLSQNHDEQSIVLFLKAIMNAYDSGVIDDNNCNVSPNLAEVIKKFNVLPHKTLDGTMEVMSIMHFFHKAGVLKEVIQMDSDRDKLIKSFSKGDQIEYIPKFLQTVADHNPEFLNQNLDNIIRSYINHRSNIEQNKELLDFQIFSFLIDFNSKEHNKNDQNNNNLILEFAPIVQESLESIKIDSNSIKGFTNAVSHIYKLPTLINQNKNFNKIAGIVKTKLEEFCDQNHEVTDTNIENYARLLGMVWHTKSHRNTRKLLYGKNADQQISLRNVESKIKAFLARALIDGKKPKKVNINAIIFESLLDGLDEKVSIDVIKEFEQKFNSFVREYCVYDLLSATQKKIVDINKKIDLIINEVVCNKQNIAEENIEEYISNKQKLIEVDINIDGLTKETEVLEAKKESIQQQLKPEIQAEEQKQVSTSKKKNSSQQEGVRNNNLANFQNQEDVDQKQSQDIILKKTISKIEELRKIQEVHEANKAIIEANIQSTREILLSADQQQDISSLVTESQLKDIDGLFEEKKNLVLNNIAKQEEKKQVLLKEIYDRNGDKLKVLKSYNDIKRNVNVYHNGRYTGETVEKTSLIDLLLGNTKEHQIQMIQGELGRGNIGLIKSLCALTKNKEKEYNVLSTIFGSSLKGNNKNAENDRGDKNSDRRDDGKLVGFTLEDLYSDKSNLATLLSLVSFKEGSGYGQRQFMPTIADKQHVMKGAFSVVHLADDAEENKTTLSKIIAKYGITVHDGCGFIKKSVYDQMVSERSKLERDPIGSNPTHVTYQTLQHLKTEIDQDSYKQAVNNAIDSGIQNIQKGNIEIGSRQSYSNLTTGGHKANSYVAVPSADDTAILPFTKKGQQVVLGRPPYDNPCNIKTCDVFNTNPKIVENVKNLEGMQYSFTGVGSSDQQYFELFNKGVLVAIPDEDWPEKYQECNIICSTKDCKIKSDWLSQKELPRHGKIHKLNGILAATDIYTKGSFVAIPKEIQKGFNGDYDGDLALVLQCQKSLYDLIKKAEQYYKDKFQNPKLQKTYTRNIDGNGNTEVTNFSSILSCKGLLLEHTTYAYNIITVLKPYYLEQIATQISQTENWEDMFKGILSEAEYQSIFESQKTQNEKIIEAMTIAIQKGIKCGTDSYKTSAPTEKLSEFIKYIRGIMQTLGIPEKAVYFKSLIKRMQSGNVNFDTLEEEIKKNKEYFNNFVLDVFSGILKEVRKSGLNDRNLTELRQFLDVDTQGMKKRNATFLKESGRKKSTTGQGVMILVTNTNGDILIGKQKKKRGDPDLLSVPKGKLDFIESGGVCIAEEPIIAAARELWEESGIKLDFGTDSETIQKPEDLKKEGIHHSAELIKILKTQLTLIKQATEYGAHNSVYTLALTEQKIQKLQLVGQLKLSNETGDKLLDNLENNTYENPEEEEQEEEIKQSQNQKQEDQQYDTLKDLIFVQSDWLLEMVSNDEHQKKFDAYGLLKHMVLKVRPRQQTVQQIKSGNESEEEYKSSQGFSNNQFFQQLEQQEESDEEQKDDQNFYKKSNNNTFFEKLQYKDFQDFNFSQQRQQEITEINVAQTQIEQQIIQEETKNSDNSGKKKKKKKKKKNSDDQNNTPPDPYQEFNDCYDQAGDGSTKESKAKYAKAVEIFNKVKKNGLLPGTLSLKIANALYHDGKYQSALQYLNAISSKSQSQSQELIKACKDQMKKKDKEVIKVKIPHVQNNQKQQNPTIRERTFLCDSKYKIVYLNYDSYQGDFVNGQRHGNGTYTKNKEDYFGEWENDKLNYGIVTSSKFIYEGKLKDYTFHGKGEIKYKDGEIYNGEWKNNKRHGKGNMSFKNGDIYEGEWQNDKRHGKGKIIYPDGVIYEGNFKNDQFHGNGKIIYPDGVIYEGNFKNDQFHGNGKMVCEDESTYDGNWKNGQRHGSGTYTKNGNTYTESWENDICIKSVLNCEEQKTLNLNQNQQQQQQNYEGQNINVNNIQNVQNIQPIPLQNNPDQFKSTALSRIYPIHRAQ